MNLKSFVFPFALVPILVVFLTGCSPLVVEPEPIVVVKPKSTVDDDVRQLLAAAEKALAADHLTVPLHDNAFDRFQAVLLLKPGHPQAKSGLQQVLLRYLELSRGAAARSEYGKARAMLERARLVDSDNPQIATLAKDLTFLQAQRQTVVPNQTVASNQTVLPDEEKPHNEYPLSPSLLDRREGEIVEKLKEIAFQARSTGETLLIVARGDAEGRWIYQQMKQAVPGFRLRGDIKLGQKAKVLLLPPID